MKESNQQSSSTDSLEGRCRDGDDRTWEQNHKPGSRLWTVLFVLGALAAAGCVVASLLSSARHGINEIEVTSIESVMFHDQLRDEQYPIQKQIWSRLLKNFDSNNFAYHQNDLPEMVRITIKQQNGNEHNITVYETGKEQGVFRVGALYYFGGNERMLDKIMDDEFRRHQKRTSISPGGR